MNQPYVGPTIGYDEGLAHDDFLSAFVLPTTVLNWTDETVPTIALDAALAVSTNSQD